MEGAIWRRDIGQRNVMSDQPSASEPSAVLQRLRENGIQSVFDVVREGRGAFVARLAGLRTDTEAQALYDLAVARASGLTRLHTSLVARNEPTVRALPKLGSGDGQERMEALSLSNSGDYASWFARGGVFPAPDSVASLFSPASYLVDLYRVAKTLHPSGNDYHIDERRPDLPTLILSQERMDTELPTLELASEILAAGIEAKPEKVNVDNVLAVTNYPFGIPYDVRADQISQALDALGTDERSVLALLHTAAGSRLGFAADAAAAAAANRAEYTAEVVRARLALSPGEYELITEASKKSADTKVLWGGITIPLESASELVQRSGLSLADIHELFCSEHAYVGRPGGNDTHPLWYGASYISIGAGGTPLLTVTPTSEDSLGTLSPIPSEVLERMHRLIRLKARVSLSYEEIDWIYQQTVPNLSSLTDVLRALATYLPLKERFDLTPDVFAAPIGQINPWARHGKVSLLDQLFQRDFYFEQGEYVDFGINASTGWDTVPGRLAQGLGIDQQTLRKIALLVAGEDDADLVMIYQTLDFWSALYRIVEIPRIAGLTVSEGLTLWSCMEKTTDDTVKRLSSSRGKGLCDDAQHILMQTLRVTDWLRERSIDVSTLMALVATKHRKTPTEDIRQFIANLHGSTSSRTVHSAENTDDAVLIEDQLARHVGTQFGLTAGVARAMIRWIDRVIGAMDSDLAAYSSTAFWNDSTAPTRILAPATPDDIGEKLVKYCHLLGQFALACHVAGLQEQDITLIVAPATGKTRLYNLDPDPDGKYDLPPLTLETVFWLCTYAEWRDTLTGSVSEARLHLGTSSTTENARYTITDFAELNGWDTGVTEKIWAALDHETLSTMVEVRQLTHWMEAATRLGLSPDNLVAMHTLLTSGNVVGNEAHRAALAPALLGTAHQRLSQAKATRLKERLAERRRDAMLLFYPRYVVPAELQGTIKTADDLYEYMLIDPQVSAKVTTSRIAEAIASVQLYMHRCREGLEPDVDKAKLAEAMRPGGYFAFWDAYNKRYGTWAGLQRLLRYPASYIEPSLRYNKTTAFHALEEALNQGRLTAQRAEEAYDAFLDEVSNIFQIEYVGGSITERGTQGPFKYLFLGRNKASPPRYFWRSYDHSGVATDVFDVMTRWTPWEPVDAEIAFLPHPEHLPSIIWFAGAVRVAWATWATIGADNGAAPESNDAELKPKIELRICIATLGKQGAWHTRTWAVPHAWFSLNESGLFYSAEPNSSSQLHFVFPGAVFPSSPHLGFKFDESLNMTLPDKPEYLVRGKAAAYTTEFRGRLIRNSSGEWIASIRPIIVNRMPMLPGFCAWRDNEKLRFDNFSTRAVPYFRRARAEGGIDTLLSYATQTAPIEPIASTGLPHTSISWVGGAGPYMWELFFHAPFLIACRLLDEQRFDEAEVWLRRIFSPSGYVDAAGAPLTDGNDKPLYWNVPPLQHDTDWGPIVSKGTDDPDSVATADPMHYKLAVYLRWMKLYMDRGDMAYRRQTRDTLTEAKMWYVQASQLLGRRPYFHDVLAGYWENPSLSGAAEMKNPALDALDALVGDDALPLPPTQAGQVRIVDGVFLAPVDEGTLIWWDRFEQRLYNLRHGLSLDGQPLILPLYETPVSPRDLQLRRLAADAGANGIEPGAVTLLGYRFVVLLDRARNAVQQLIQFGNALQSIFERRDGDALTVLQQVQTVQIHDLTRESQALQIDILEHSATGLQIARADASERQHHYAGLAAQYMNTAEIASMGLRVAAPPLLIGSVAANVTAAALDMVPNTWIAGMAAGVGGTTWSSLARALAEGLTTEANAMEMSSGTLDMVAGFDRRREEWLEQSRLAGTELAQIEQQIEAGNKQLAQTLKQLTQMDIEKGYAQAVLDTLTTRFTGKDLFNWQASRMSTLYYQLYDVTLSLCASAQKAYAFETGDATSFLQPGAWNDLYQGLLAGESLALGLQRLERAHLTWDQRALEVERTISLGALAGEPLSTLIADALATANPTATSGKIIVGYDSDVLTLSFVLKDAGIADDYPTTLQLGAKRRIKSLAVTLPALLGPYEDIRAVLGYAGGVAATLPSGCTAVALSRGLADSGQFVLDFNDGRYQPFEGIPIDDNGTLSLRFPNTGQRPQEDMLRSITDVILHVRYTIRRDN